MKHILIVDDNKTNLISAKTVLSDTYKVTPVTMGAQAIKFLENNTCDLILLDVDMPEMDGFEVLSRIKHKNIPVLFLTGNTDATTLARCIDDGGLDVLEKPFVKSVLLNRISLLFELLEYRNK